VVLKFLLFDKYFYKCYIRCTISSSYEAWNLYLFYIPLWFLFALTLTVYARIIRKVVASRRSVSSLSQPPSKILLKTISIFVSPNDYLTYNRDLHFLLRILIPARLFVCLDSINLRRVLLTQHTSHALIHAPHGHRVQHSLKRLPILSSLCLLYVYRHTYVNRLYCAI
jgi:hypothetical protein